MLNINISFHRLMMMIWILVICYTVSFFHLVSSFSLYSQVHRWSLSPSSKPNAFESTCKNDCDGTQRFLRRRERQTSFPSLLRLSDVDDDEKFGNAEELKAWLMGKGIDPDIDNESKTLFEEKYDRSSRLFGVTFDELVNIEVQPPIAREISNKLQQQADVNTQQDDVETLTEYDNTKFNSPSEMEKPYCFQREDQHAFLCPRGYRADSARQVLNEAYKEDTDPVRVSPIMLNSCSRSGKTRTMGEIFGVLYKWNRIYRRNMNVVYISFNTDTPFINDIRSKVPRSPKEEICTRIAFAALKRDKSNRRDEKSQFQEFYNNYRVGEEWVIDWLKDDGCILFIDELNLLEDKIENETSNFLRQNFLSKIRRELVFSSHTSHFGDDLNLLMSSPSARQLKRRPIPFVTNLTEAREIFVFPDLTAAKAIYLGLLPGLIENEKNSYIQNWERRTRATDKFLKTLKNKEEYKRDTIKLLKTLLTGDGEEIDSSLQEFMTADEIPCGEPDAVNKTKNILRWVPYHMEHVLSRIAKYAEDFTNLSKNDKEDLIRFKKCLQTGIVDQFKSFGGAKTKDGTGWESLFLVVLVVRCLTKSFDDVVVDLKKCGHDPEKTPSVRVNGPYGTDRHNDFDEENSEEWIKGIPDESWAAQGEEAISIYYPTHNQFQKYDVILAFWNSQNVRYLYGYQMKEGTNQNKGKGKKTKVGKVLPGFHRNIVVWGNRNVLTDNKGGPDDKWLYLGTNTIKNFFGASGSFWTPAKCDELDRTKGAKNARTQSGPKKKSARQ